MRIMQLEPKGNLMKRNVVATYIYTAKCKVNTLVNKKRIKGNDFEY